MSAVGVVTVTGAAGFVGREVIRQLRGRVPIRAIVRGRVLAGDLSGADVEQLRVDDLAGPAAQDAACNGARTIIHLAARVHRMDDRGPGVEDHYVRENVELTRSLAWAAVRAGAIRFVFLSSVKALGERSASGPLRTDASARPEDAYGRSKLAAEHALAEVAAESGLEVVVLRPPLVYGPDVGANFRQLVRWVARGIPLPLASATNRRSMVSVWNLADAIRAATEHPGAAGGTFHVADARPVSTPDLVRLVAEGLGRRPRLVHFPPALLATALRAAGRGSLVDRLLGSLELDTTSTASRLGWVPRIAIEDGLRRSAREMKL